MKIENEEECIRILTVRFQFETLQAKGKRRRKSTKMVMGQQRIQPTMMRTMTVPPMRLLVALLLAACWAHAAHPDTHPDCAIWAERGECEVSDQSYLVMMLVS